MFYHHVKNDTDGVRVVLYIDVIRKGLPPVMSQMNDLMIYILSHNVLLNAVVAKQHVQIINKN